tara:strand:+ start:750 stop:947 length:198 start_codon:yes stop_codon:yes gene_type:complete
MNINLHNVTKIEVKPRHDHKDFSVRDIVFHTKEFNYDLNGYSRNTFEVSCFLKEKDVAKLIYSKK